MHCDQVGEFRLKISGKLIFLSGPREGPGLNMALTIENGQFGNGEYFQI
jgi:hypothetical protein